MIYKFLLILTLLFSSCSNFTTIKLSDFNKYMLKEEHTPVILIKSFIVDRKCDSAKQIFYANVFLCKTNPDNDTIMVLNFCKPPFDFLKGNYKEERDLIIDSTMVLQSYPSQAIVDIDDSIYKKGYKFIVADITRLEY